MECFIFTFADDTLAYGRSCSNGLLVNVKGTTSGRYLNIMTMVGEVTDDCWYFHDITRLVDNCFYEKERLIFAYTQDGVRYHLRFKEVIPRLEPFANTSRKLSENLGKPIEFITFDD
jgi:hypothetical protein